MNTPKGWVKLHRELLDKPIWLKSTAEQKSILITILLLANHKAADWEWKGKKYRLQPGEFITSLKSLAEKCGDGVSIQNVRTALKKFCNIYGFITLETTSQNTKINVVNWEKYQTNSEHLTKSSTKGQQSNHIRATTNKNDKNEKKKERERRAKDFPPLVGEVFMRLDRTERFSNLTPEIVANVLRNYPENLLSDPVELNGLATEAMAEGKPIENAHYWLIRHIGDMDLRLNGADDRKYRKKNRRYKPAEERCDAEIAFGPYPNHFKGMDGYGDHGMRRRG